MRPGPKASLCASEVITLSIFARWSRFASERDFYRYAQTNPHDAFPTLPSRPQFNRLLRSHTKLIEDFFLHLLALLEAQKCPYEALDSSAMPVRDAKRRGGMDGSPDGPTAWAGPTGWAGRRVSLCSARSIAPG